MYDCVGVTAPSASTTGRPVKELIGFRERKQVAVSLIFLYFGEEYVKTIGEKFQISHCVCI